MTVNVNTVFAEGGEAFIYKIDDNHLAKIYKDNINLAEKEKKVKTLIKLKLPKEVVKPIDTIVDDTGKFVGYIMPKVNGDDFKRLSNKKFVTNKNLTTKDILQILSSAWKVINEIHKLGIVIGDLNDQNILFNADTKDVYFIDVDSWSVAGIPCTVAMDIFKDPKLVGCDFNEGTDTFAFCVLAFKSLTRLHPYGGTMNPDINIIDRMSKGISVIDNANVKIPKMCKSWRNLSPDLISDFKNVFNNGSRRFGNLLDDNLKHLIFCDKDHDFYYSGFQSCPICNAGARIIAKATSVGIENGFKVAKILNDNIKTVFSQYAYMNMNNEVVNVRTGNTVSYAGARVLFDSNGNSIHRYKDKMIVVIGDKCSEPGKPKTLHIPIQYNTYPVADGEYIYYVSNAKEFCKFKIINNSIGVTKIDVCSYDNYYNACDGHYCLVNVYNNKIITNIDGFYSTLDFDKQILSCASIYDKRLGLWLIIIEDSAQCYHSYILNKNICLWNSDRLNYKCSPHNICFDNGIIYIPIDDAIRGFNYKTMNYKDFKCEIISSDSQLVKDGSKFLIVNDDNIYMLYK